MLDKNEILQRTNFGLDIYNHYLGFEVNLHKNFKSPFYEDRNASCHIFFDNKNRIYRFYDHGDATYSGDCFWFVATLKNLDVQREFYTILTTIVEELNLNIDILHNKPFTNNKIESIKTFNIKFKDTSVDKSYIIEKQPFDKTNLAYWNYYGITESILMKYNVVSAKRFQSCTQDGKLFKIKATSTEPIYAYEQIDFIKIYRPHSQKCKFLYAGNKDSDYCFGYEQLPTKGDIVFITGGEKDVLSLAAHGFNAICFNSETAQISESIIKSLKHRFQHIIILYDSDETGIRESTKQLEKLKQYNVLNLTLPLSGTKTEKDISDYFALGHNALHLKTLINESLNKTYSNTIQMMKNCEIDYNNPPNISEAIISVNDVPIGTQNNLLCITGGEGTGKSNYISAIISGTLGKNLPSETTLGLKIANNIRKHAVLHYDTEQSENQLYKNVDKTLRRAELSSVPSYYHSFFLSSYSRADRMKLIRESMDLFYHRYGGIFLVVIDGIADLIKSANDEMESIAIVDELYRLAGIYNTCIICVLHFVPNGVKLRGHIGSELQRKSAGILSIEKDEDPVYSIVKALKVRDGSPLDVPMMMFAWDKEKNMHTYSGEKSKEDKEKRKYNELEQVIKIAFSGHKSLPYTDLCNIIMNELSVKDRTAKKYISFMKEQNLIGQDAYGNYQKKK